MGGRRTASSPTISQCLTKLIDGRHTVPKSQTAELLAAAGEESGRAYDEGFRVLPTERKQFSIRFQAASLVVMAGAIRTRPIRD